MNVNLLSAQQKKNEMNKQPLANKNNKTSDFQNMQNSTDEIIVELKIKVIKRIVYLSNAFKEFVVLTTFQTNENISLLELLTQNVFKTENGLIKSTVVYLAKKIEDEAKLEHSIKMDKFKFVVDRDFSNFMIEKPKPLFDLEMIDWKKFD